MSEEDINVRISKQVAAYREAYTGTARARRAERWRRISSR